MPLYEYILVKCKKSFTLLVTIGEYEKQKSFSCPHCDSKDLKRIYSTFTAVTSKKSWILKSNRSQSLIVSKVDIERQ